MDQTTRVGLDQPPRVLIVDDTPTLLEALRGVLTRNGFTVVGLADNGSEAIPLASTAAPDAAVVDYSLPDIDGLATAAGIKMVRPQCRVVLFSASDMEHGAPASPHVDQFLHKVHAQRLVETVTEITLGR